MFKLNLLAVHITFVISFSGMPPTSNFFIHSEELTLSKTKRPIGYISKFNLSLTGSRIPDRKGYDVELHQNVDGVSKLVFANEQELNRYFTDGSRIAYSLICHSPSI